MAIKPEKEKIDERDVLRSYIRSTPFVELITNGLDGFPNTRLFGHYANDAYDVFFSTTSGTQKIRELQNSSGVAIYYKHDDQSLDSFYTVTIYGTAERLERDSPQFRQAMSLISARSESFKKKIETSGFDTLVLYKVSGKKVKVLDFSKGRGRAAVFEFMVKETDHDLSWNTQA